jgi:hypothetical protein
MLAYRIGHLGSISCTSIQIPVKVKVVLSFLSVILICHSYLSFLKEWEYLPELKNVRAPSQQISHYNNSPPTAVTLTVIV